VVRKPKPKKDMGHLYRISYRTYVTTTLIWLTIIGYIVYVEFFTK